MVHPFLLFLFLFFIFIHKLYRIVSPYWTNLKLTLKTYFIISIMLIKLKNMQKCILKSWRMHVLCVVIWKVPCCYLLEWFILHFFRTPIYLIILESYQKLHMWEIGEKILKLCFFLSHRLWPWKKLLKNHKEKAAIHGDNSCWFIMERSWKMKVLWKRTKSAKTVFLLSCLVRYTILFLL